MGWLAVAAEWMVRCPPGWLACLLVWPLAGWLPGRPVV